MEDHGGPTLCLPLPHSMFASASCSSGFLFQIVMQSLVAHGSTAFVNALAPCLTLSLTVQNPDRANL
jgi:hypothetical protein